MKYLAQFGLHDEINICIKYICVNNSSGFTFHLTCQMLKKVFVNSAYTAKIQTNSNKHCMVYVALSITKVRLNEEINDVSCFQELQYKVLVFPFKHLLNFKS